MATYKDYQALANKVYDKDNSVIVYNNPERPLEKTTWTKVGIEFDSNGKATKYLESPYYSIGYYGAVYQNGNEYILVNRGTDNFTNLGHDLDMWLRDVAPAEYLEAKELMTQVQEYLKTHSGSLSIAGHSLGGSLSQLLSVEFGYDAVTFNSFNTRVLLDNMKSQNYNFTDLRTESDNIQSHIAALKDAYGGTTLEEAIAIKIENLQKQKQSIDTILGSEKLINSYQSGSDPQNITNFMMAEDTVSTHYFDQLGTEIRLSVIPSSFEQDQPVEFYQKYWDSFASKPATDLTFSDHFMKNFDIDEINRKLADGEDVFIRLTDASIDQLQVNSLLQSFNDKAKYEINRLSGGLLRVTTEYELYFMPAGASAKPASTELIGELYDPSYQQAVFAKAGTKADIETLVNELKAKGATKSN